MNTPSKEALDASEAVQDYLGFPRRATIDLATIIDRHFEPLRQRLAEMESLLASEKTTRNAIIAKGQQTEARVKELEVSNSELRESHAAIYLALATLEADCSKWPDQIRALRAATDELTGALRSAVNELERATTYSDGMPSVSHNLKYNLRAVLASHAAGEPEAQT